MGWLNRLTGRKKAAETEDEIPESYNALLDSAELYIMKAMILAMARGHERRKEALIQQKLDLGVAPEQAATDAESLSITADENRPAPMSTALMVIQFSSQLARYASKPSLSLTYLAAAVLLIKVLRMENFARSNELDVMLRRHDDLTDLLIETFGTPPESAPSLNPKTATMTTGIVVGNRMAQDFLSQTHAQKEPEVGDDVTALFQRHLLLNGRQMGDGATFDIDPIAFVPDVRKWITSESPEVLTVFAKGSRTLSW
jgi:hypothetical protein